MKKEVTLIFDIGKTNKKWFLFNDKLEILASASRTFAELKDEDGYPCDDLLGLIEWIKSSVSSLQKSAQYQVKKVNFSAYGASLVHLDKAGKLVLPFYNYTKALPKDFYTNFFSEHLDKGAFSTQTGSPILGMLNSGFQLYYLKKYKLKHYKRIETSLHFPQFLSYLFTGIKGSDYTSIGCHTALWDFQKKDYHDWVYREGIDKKLGKIEATRTSYQVEWNGESIEFGLGIHDSSAALYSHQKMTCKEFCLLSTGTWSIAMNPFNSSPLTEEEFSKDCLSFLNTAGSVVKASRLFLGKEFDNQLKKLADFYEVHKEQYQSIPYKPNYKQYKRRKGELIFDYKHLQPYHFNFKSKAYSLSEFDSFDHAYYNLMDELTDIQISSLKLIMDFKQTHALIIDGGFSQNEHFVQLLAKKLSPLKIYTSSIINGAALGAGLMVNKDSFLEQTYQKIILKP